MSHRRRDAAHARRRRRRCRRHRGRLPGHLDDPVAGAGRGQMPVVRRRHFCEYFYEFRFVCTF